MNPSALENGHQLKVTHARDCEDASFDPAQACAASRQAQFAWAAFPLTERLKVIARFRQLLAEQAEIVASAATAQPARSVAEILASEIAPLAEACRFAERNAVKILEPRRVGRAGRPLWLMGVCSEVRREPFGLVLIIAPSNYPIFLPGVQIIQSLVAGNSVLLKPGNGGSSAARELVRLLNVAGLPANLLHILPDAPEAAQYAIAAGVDKVFFTGSARTGARVLAQLAPTATPAAMELSGCDAVIIRADADLDLAVRAIAFGLRLNASQTCIAPRRVFVSRTVATEFEGRLAQALSGQAVTIPPQHSQRLSPLVRDALAAGAHLLSGQFQRDGNLAGPLVLAGVKPGLALLKEDIFAPALAILTVSSDDEALQLANDCPYALGVTIFSRDEEQARLLAGRVNAGVVVINDLIAPTADARLPFGGRKLSGFGMTRGPEGLLEMTTTKVVVSNRAGIRPHFDPPRHDDAELFHHYLGAAHGRTIGQRLKAIGRLIRTLIKRR